MINEEDIPVIAVDGPSGSGKGTVCRLLARELGWNLLDSGALYRLVGLAARNHGVRLDNHAALEVLAGHLDVQFRPGDDAAEARVILEGEDVSQLLRSEEVGALRLRGCGGAQGARLAAAAPARVQDPSRAWWRTDATWARWCSRRPSSRCS